MTKREFLRTSGSVGLALLLGDRVWARFADTLVKAIWARVEVSGSES
jgi:hypothetical protein